MGLLSRLFSKVEDDKTVTVVNPIDVGIVEEEMVEVVGESNYQDAIRSACSYVDGTDTRFECMAELLPEPTNPYDPNAVMIKVDGQCVGYLSRKDAKTLGPAIADGIAGQGTGMCRAVIAGRADGETRNLGVFLHLKISRTV